MQRPTFCEKLDSYLMRESQDIDSIQMCEVSDLRESNSPLDDSICTGSELDHYILKQTRPSGQKISKNSRKFTENSSNYDTQTLLSQDTFQTAAFQIALSQKKKIIEQIMQKNAMKRKKLS